MMLIFQIMALLSNYSINGKIKLPRNSVFVIYYNGKGVKAI